MSDYIEEDGTEVPARRAPAKRAQPHKPAGVKEPQDHKKPAAQREAEGENMVTVEFWDMEFTFCGDPLEWPAEAALAFEENRFSAFIKNVCGAQTFFKFTHSNPEPKNRDTQQLFRLMAKAIGGDAGE